MNIGLIAPLNESGNRAVFADLAERGFHHIQLSGWTPSHWTDERAEEIKALCKEFDIEITAFWCGWSGDKTWNFIDGPETIGIVPPVYRQQRLEDLKNGADFAKKLGVQDVVTHMGFIPENMSDPLYPGVVAAVRLLANHLKENDQNLLFETGQETPVVLLRLFEAVGTGNLYVNLDTANLILYGKADPVGALEVLGKHVKGVHIKDGFYPTCGSELGQEAKVGTGLVNFPVVLRRLVKLGYDGSLTIEREISGEQQRRDIEDTRKYLEEILAEIAKEGAQQ